MVGIGIMLFFVLIELTGVTKQLRRIADALEEIDKNKSNNNEKPADIK